MTFRWQQFRRAIFAATGVLYVATFLYLVWPIAIPLRENPTRVSSLYNLRQIGRAMEMYAKDNDGRLPEMYYIPFVQFALHEYIKTDAIWDCPQTPNEPFSINPVFSGKKRESLPVGSVLVYEARPYKDNRRVTLFVGKDRSLVTKWLPEDQWVRQMHGSHNVYW